MTIASADDEVVQLLKSSKSIGNPVSARGCNAFVDLLAELESARALEGLEKVGVARSLISLANEVLQKPPTTTRAFDNAAHTEFDPRGV